MAKPEKNQQDKIDALYQWLSFELQQARDTLLGELRMSSAQIGSLYNELKAESEESTSAISQEIRYSYKQNQTIYDGLASMLTKEVGERLNSMEEKIVALENLQVVIDELNELKYNYMSVQQICSNTNAVVANEVNPKLDAISAYVTEEVAAKLAELCEKLEGYLPTEEDYKKYVDQITEKTEESVNTHSAQILDAVAAIPVAENVDYNRIVEEVGDKVLDLLNQIKATETAPVETKIDYDRIICGSAEKVVESLPYPEKVDYARIENAVAGIDMDALAEAVAAKIVIPVPAVPEIDYDRLAEAVAAKIVVPVPETPDVDYDKISELVVEKMTAETEQTCEVLLDDAGIEEIATKVADKITTPESIDYDKVCQAAQAAQILPDPIDYDRIAEIVEDKLAGEEPTYDLVIDEEGISAIAKGVSEEICQMCASCELECEECPEEMAVEPVEEPVEETVEEVEETVVEEPAEELVEETVEEVEEPAQEEPAEEPVEETVEEVEAPVVEETPVEEPAEESAPEEMPAAEELAAAVAISEYQEIGNDLVDAETGLVIRLKRSFTAKMRQSDEKVKGYYSDLKNELTSYKKVNSNVSWHGDRFNYGRETVAKINICGKTLCFYVALDPNDPEYKTTVYHQKDVSSQKAYENTPFMVKVKSDAAAKKALRLVGYLAEKLGTEKDANFEAVDYVEEYEYQSTKRLFDEGYIKATKEKKVDLDF